MGKTGGPLGLLPRGVQTGFKEKLPPRKAGRASLGAAFEGLHSFTYSEFFVLQKGESASATVLLPTPSQRLVAATILPMIAGFHSSFISPGKTPDAVS